MSNIFPVTHSVLSVKALATTLLPEFGLRAISAVRLLNRGLNDTYLVKTNGDEKYIFRVYRSGWRSRSDILYELDALNHLSHKDIAVARPLPQSDGTFIQTVPAPEGIRYAILFTYAPGKEPTYEQEGERPAFHYGKSAAKVHNAMQDFTSQHARFPLDLTHLLTTPLQSIEPLLAHRPEDWAYLQRLSEKIGNQLADLPIDALAQGFCHGDFHGGNAHLDDDNTVTFFDFDCCGWGWHAYDIAVFCWGARLMNKEKELWEPFLRGYQEERLLNDIDLQAIPLFVGIRHFWLLGLHTGNGQDWGFGWINDRYFDHAIKFLKDWEEQT